LSLLDALPISVLAIILSKKFLKTDGADKNIRRTRLAHQGGQPPPRSRTGNGDYRIQIVKGKPEAHESDSWISPGFQRVAGCQARRSKRWIRFDYRIPH